MAKNITKLTLAAAGLAGASAAVILAKKKQDEKSTFSMEQNK